MKKFHESLKRIGTLSLVAMLCLGQFAASAFAAQDTAGETGLTVMGAILSGSGTADDPYRINDADDWFDFSEMVRNDYDLYGESHYKLMNDITVSGMYSPYDVAYQVSIGAFGGTFDGNNNTLTFSFGGATDFVSPFKELEGGTIKNLCVEGTVSAAGGHLFAAGIAGQIAGDSFISNCTINATIRGSGTGSGQNGGLVGKVSPNTTVTIDNCVFNGEINGSVGFKCGGFVGCNEGTVNITDCLFAPENIGVGSNNLYAFVQNVDNGSHTLSGAYRTWHGSMDKLNQGLRVYDSRPEDMATVQMTCIDGVDRWAEAGTITFDVNGHGTAPSSQIVAYGMKATEPAEPAAEGVRFDGWYEDENYYKLFRFDTEIYRNYTLYAKWNRLAEISFDPNGGGGTMEPVNVEVETGMNYQLPACEFTAPAGKGFKNWSIDGTACNPVQWVHVENDTVVRAEWEDLVTVTFDAGGGSGTMEAVPVVKGTKYTLPSCGYTGVGDQIFTGWTTGGDKYSPGQEVTISDDTTFTANWTDLLTLNNRTAVVAETVTVDTGRIEVTGNSTLVLSDGITLTVPKGIHVPEGSRLTIKGKGSLVIDIGTGSSNDYHAGIGGNYQDSCGTIVIESGNITIRENTYSACIGGAYGGTSGGTVIINGGRINVTSGYMGYALGGNGAAVEINGGQITADNWSTGTKGIKGSTIKLGWTAPTDYINAVKYEGAVTFSDSRPFVLENTNTQASADNIAGRKIIPAGAVTVGQVTNGTVALGDDIESGSLFAVGSVVTLDVTPAAGFRVGSVKYGTTEIEPVEGVYSFEMPAEDVIVTATFITDPATVPTISGHPVDLNLITGQTGDNVLSVEATAASGHTLSYQWYSNTVASNTGGAAISGATSASYAVPTDRQAGTYYYYCEVTAARTDNGTTATAASDAATVTIGKRTVTITAHDENYTYVPGETFDVSTLFTFPEDAGVATMSIVTGTDAGTGAGTLAGPLLRITKAGTIRIRVSTAASGYVSSAAATATLTVAKAAGNASISVDDVTYGTEVNPVVSSSTNTSYTISYRKAGGSASTTAPSAAGSYTATVTYAATDLYDAATASDTFIIGEAPLTVTADAAGKNYGEADPELTYTVSGFENGDSETVMTGALTRESGEDVGAYDITRGTLSAGDNYTISFTGASFTISKADAVITIAEGKDSYEKKYGDRAFALGGITTNVGNAPLTYEVTSGSDVVSVSDTGVVTLLKPGSAVITVSLSGTDNYNAAEAQTITVTVSKAEAPKPSSGNNSRGSGGLGSSNSSVDKNNQGNNSNASVDSIINAARITTDRLIKSIRLMSDNRMIKMIMGDRLNLLYAVLIERQRIDLAGYRA